MKNLLTTLPQSSALPLNVDVKVTLDCAYIASGRFISDVHIAIRVLDSSEISQKLRTNAHIHFEIDACQRMCISGEAFIRLGSTVYGHDGRRYLEAVLNVENARERAVEIAPAYWLT